MDNLLSGVENESEAVSYFHEANDLMFKGNFVLHQWCTNSTLLHTEIHNHSIGNLAQFQFWDFLGTPILKSFRSLHKILIQPTRNLQNAKFLAWQANCMTFWVCCHQLLFLLPYLSLTCGRKHLAGINPCPPVLPCNGTPLKKN